MLVVGAGDIDSAGAGDMVPSVAVGAGLAMVPVSLGIGEALACATTKG